MYLFTQRKACTFVPHFSKWICIRKGLLQSRYGTRQHFWWTCDIYGMCYLRKEKKKCIASHCSDDPKHCSFLHHNQPSTVCQSGMENIEILLISWHWRVEQQVTFFVVLLYGTVNCLLSMSQWPWEGNLSQVRQMWWISEREAVKLQHTNQME